MASASSTFTILGRPAALEGDTIECRACKSAGVIACAGPRHLDTFNGRALALEGDLCMCRCQEHPQLVAGQQSSFHTLDGIGTDLSPAPAHEARQDGADALATSDRVHDKPLPWIGFRLDEASSCEGVSCRILFDDGSQAWATCMAGNRLRLHGVGANSALRIEYCLDQADSVASLTALLLERIAT